MANIIILKTKTDEEAHHLWMAMNAAKQSGQLGIVEAFQPSTKQAALNYVGVLWDPPAQRDIGYDYARGEKLDGGLSRDQK